MKIKYLGFLTKGYKNNNVFLIANCMLEFSSGVIVGIIIGYFIDKACNTKPIFIIVFMCLGFVSGLMNLKRYITKNKL